MSEPAPVVTALQRGPTPSFTRLASRYLREYLGKIRTAVERLDEDQVWWRPTPTSNSVGNLLLHLAGNLSMWILVGLAGVAYERRRREEFEADRSQSREDLLRGLESVVERCIEALEGVGDDTLATPIDVQGYATNRLGALFHAVEHMSYHTGQILMVVKQLTVDPAHPFELYPQHRDE